MTTKEELQQQLEVVTRKRKETQVSLKNENNFSDREISILNSRIKRLRGEIDHLRYTIRHMPKTDLQKPAIMEKPEFKQRFREAVGIQQEPVSVMRLDTMEDLDKAWPNIKGMNIAIEAPEEIKAELMRRWRKEFNKIEVVGFRPVQFD